MSDLSQHYDALASKRDYYRSKNEYYYSLLNKEYRYFVPKGKRVLEIGCGTGDLLNALSPSYGLGVDISGEMIKLARKKYLQLKFETGEVHQINIQEKFDYIILSGLLGEVEDIQKCLESLRPFCTKDTRIIIEYYSYFWQYILKIGERFDLKISQKIQNWLSAQDIFNFLKLAGFESVSCQKSILFPKHIPILSYFFNRFIAKLPIFNALTLSHFIIARTIIPPIEELSTTIVVPCRNEKGNIEQAITRTPEFGLKQEFIFVEGGSSDGTFEEVQRIIKKYPDKDIKLFKQEGKGKGDAVRLGFSKAQEDILMILDADLTVAPEELPKFYEAIRSHQGEFINGCRLIYPMEKEAMRFLNLIANKFFGIFFSWLLGQPFKDTLCGTKVMLRNQYEELAANRSYFGDIELNLVK